MRDNSKSAWEAEVIIEWKTSLKVCDPDVLIEWKTSLKVREMLT